jgi:alpha-tubulin suppressor-like RCC1 family protein/V8-like Glu-specific endopeptidase
MSVERAPLDHVDVSDGHTVMWSHLRGGRLMRMQHAARSTQHAARSTRRLVGLFFCALGIVQFACSDSRGSMVRAGEPVIFGSDDRKNPIDPAVTPAARAWADAVGVMAGPPASVVSGKFPKDALCLETSSPDVCYLNMALATKGPVFASQVTQKSYGLCADEKFAQETVLRADNSCTVFRLPQTAEGEELFLTAGHCLKPTGATAEEGRECKDAEFAFGYQVRSFGTEHPMVGLPFALRRKWDVYKCKEVVARAHPLSNSTGDDSDFTLFKADRVVRGRHLLDVRRSNTLAANQPTTVAGHGAGFPLKITPTGVVKFVDATANTFAFSSDVLGGDSGAPVIDVNSGLVTGIVAAVPEENFYLDAAANCARVAPKPPCSDATGCPTTGFATATDIMEIGSVPNLPATPTVYADLDGDGLPDKITFVVSFLVWALDIKFSSAGKTCTACPIATPIPAFVPLGQIAAATYIGDFNGDGAHDIIVQLPGYATVYLEGVDLTKLLNPLAVSQAFFGMDQYAGTLVGDFNSDGLDDVRAFSTSGTHADVLMGTPSADPGQGAAFSGGLAPSIEIPAECGNDVAYIVPGNHSSMFPSLTAYTSTRGVAVVPGSVVGLSDPTLLVIDCPGATKKNQLKLLDPLTGQVRKTLTMTGTSEWRALAYRASKQDLIGLRSPNDPKGSYDVVRIGLSASNSPTTSVLATRPQSGIATGIAWDDVSGELGVLVTNSCAGPASCLDDRIDYFGESTPGAWSFKYLSKLSQKTCSENYSKPSTVEPSGLIMSGADEMVACNRRGFGIGFRDARSKLVLNEVPSVSATPWHTALHLHDVECDTKTYASVFQTVVWGVSRSGRVLRALPVTSSDCGFGGQPPATAKCVVSESGVSRVAAGGSSTLFLSDDGTVRGAGDNTHGQLALPAGANVAAATPVPGYFGASDVAVGAGHSLALFGDGVVKAAGHNSAGQLGRDDVTATAVPAQVAGIPPVSAVAAGDDFSLALGVDGSVWAWGANDHGQLGDGTRSSRFTPVRVRGLENISSTFSFGFGSFGSQDGQFAQPRGVATDTASVFVADQTNRVQRFLPDGTLTAVFGATGTGPGQFLGSAGLHAAARRDGTALYVLDPAAVEVQKFAIVAPSQSCPAATVEVLSSGARVCFVTRWGNYGSGNGDLASPSGLAAGAGGEVFVADAGNHRVQRFVHVALSSACPSGTTEVSAVGAERTCAAGHFGGLGSGDGQLSGPRAVACDPDTSALFIADTGNHRLQRFSKDGAFLGKWGSFGAGPGQLDTPVDVDVDELGRVIVTEAGNKRAQIFTAGGSLLSVLGGPGAAGGQFQSPIGAAVLGARVFVADSQLHRVQAFDVSGQAGVVRIAAGGRHGLALGADGRVWAWGANDSGQLGAGNSATASSTVPVGVVDPLAAAGLLSASEIAAGARHSLAVRVDGSVRAWGDNSEGQLGDGTTTNRDVATPVLNAINVTLVRAGALHSTALTAVGWRARLGRKLPGPAGGRDVRCSGGACRGPRAMQAHWLPARRDGPRGGVEPHDRGREPLGLG